VPFVVVSVAGNPRLANTCAQADVFGAGTIQESTNATVADKEDIAGSISDQDVLALAHNAQLGINRSLPTSNAGVGLREKLISYRLKLVMYQEARRRSIVLMHRFTNLYVGVQFCGNNLDCLDRLAFRSLLETICVVPESGPVLATASVRALLTSLRPQDGTGMAGSNIYLRIAKIAYEVRHD
jgi:hypothetical protein